MIWDLRNRTEPVGNLQKGSIPFFIHSSSVLEETRIRFAASGFVRSSNSSAFVLLLSGLVWVILARTWGVRSLVLRRLNHISNQLSLYKLFAKPFRKF